MSRRDHAAEMRYALAHNCSLDKARAALAQLRWRAREEARAKAQEASRQPRASLGVLPPADQSRYWWQERD